MHILPGTSGNRLNFMSSIFVAKVNRMAPVNMATPVPYGEWKILVSSTWLWETSCERINAFKLKNHGCIFKMYAFSHCPCWSVSWSHQRDRRQAQCHPPGHTVGHQKPSNPAASPLHSSTETDKDRSYYKDFLFKKVFKRNSIL